MVESKPSRLMGTRGKSPIPKSIEARNPKINQARSLKPRLASRDGALT